MKFSLKPAMNAKKMNSRQPLIFDNIQNVAMVNTRIYTYLTLWLIKNGKIELDWDI